MKTALNMLQHSRV